MRMFPIVAVLLMCAGAAHADVKPTDRCDYNTKEIRWECVKKPQVQTHAVVKCALWSGKPKTSICEKWVKIVPKNTPQSVDQEIIKKKLIAADPLLQKQQIIKKKM